MSESHDVTSQEAISHSHAAHDAQTAVESHEEQHPHVNYMMVFAALIVFTIVSYLADVLGAHMGASPETKKIVKTVVGLVVLIVASFKALAVMMYFMHLKFERLWKYALLAPTIILALALIVSLMPDMAGSYYARVIPQTKDAAAAHHSDGGPEHPAAVTKPQEGTTPGKVPEKAPEKTPH